MALQAVLVDVDVIVVVGVYVMVVSIWGSPELATRGECALRMSAYITRGGRGYCICDCADETWKCLILALTWQKSLIRQNGYIPLVTVDEDVILDAKIQLQAPET